MSWVYRMYVGNKGYTTFYYDTLWKVGPLKSKSRYQSRNKSCITEIDCSYIELIQVTSPHLTSVLNSVGDQMVA
jgi:hypothetical protein